MSEIGRQGYLCMDGWAGRQEYAVLIVEETPKRRRPVRPVQEATPQKLGRMVLMLSPEDGATVLVPYDHPWAVAKRRGLRASADVSLQEGV